MEPFAQAVAFSSKEYVSGRVIDVHGLLLDGHWVGTYIGDEQSTKSEIQEINDIVALREKALLDKHTARIAELERVLEELVNSFNSVVSYSSDYYSLADYEAGIPQRWTIDAKIKSVLGRGE